MHYDKPLFLYLHSEDFTKQINRTSPFKETFQPYNHKPTTHIFHDNPRLTNTVILLPKTYKHTPSRVSSSNSF